MSATKPKAGPAVKKFKFVAGGKANGPAQWNLALLPTAPPGSSYIVRDTHTPGLALRVTGTGFKSFLFCYRSDELDSDGKRKERRIEMDLPWQPGQGRLDDARAKVEILRGEVADKKRVGQEAVVLSPRERRRLDKERKAAEVAATEAARIEAEREAAKHSDVTQLAERYLEEHAKLNKRSWKEDERRLNKYVIPWAGERKARDITRADIAEWLAPVAKGDKANGIPPRPVEANARLALLRKVFSFALNVGVVEHHPCLRMPAPGGRTPVRDRALQTGREFRVFWRLTDGYLTQARPAGRKRYKWRHPHLPADVADALRLVLMTGCRIEEITGLRWSEIDMEQGHIDLPKARVKNKRDHMLPLIEPAMDLLRRRKEATKGSRYVFPSIDDDGKPAALRRDRVSHVLRPIADNLLPRIGMEGFTAHDLRRTVETGMAAARVPKEYRDRVLNHVDGSVGGMNYNKWDYIDEKREALEKWWQRFASLRDAPLPSEAAPSNVVPMRKRAKA